MPADDIGELFMTIWRRWKVASPVGRGAITQEQYWILRTLEERGPTKVKDLALELGCTAGSASVAVKRLQRAGLANRERSSRDERIVTISLVRNGAVKLREWRSEQIRSFSDLFSALGESDRRTLKELLSKAVASNRRISTASSRKGAGD